MARQRVTELPVGFVELEPNRLIATVDIGHEWVGLSTPADDPTMRLDGMLIRLRPAPGLDEVTLLMARNEMQARGATVKVLPIQHEGLPAQPEQVKGVEVQTIREAIAARLAKSPDVAEYVWGIYDTEDKGVEP
jgi:hypothetical protein